MLIMVKGGGGGGLKLNLNVKMENPKIRPPPSPIHCVVNMFIKVKRGGGGGDPPPRTPASLCLPPKVRILPQGAWD